MERRTFLSTAAAAAAFAPLVHPADAAAASTAAADELIDTNVYLSDWAVRHSWANSPAALLRKLRQHGVTSAWVGSFEGVLHTDVAGANARLAEACAKEGGGILRPFGNLNPTFPDWEEDLRRCHEVHRMAGVRLFPNYHGYTLEDPRFAQLLDNTGRRGLLVQIVISIEDERSQNPALTAAPLQPAPLADVLEKIPNARVMLLNSAARVLAGTAPLLPRLVKAGVTFEIATLETVAGIESLLHRSPNVRLCFGSHSPYFYFEAALLKLQESALSADQLSAIRHGHARSALRTA